MELKIFSAHPNLVAFGSHGGLMSTIEALDKGVPVIGFPIFADQIINMRRFQAKGLGLVLEYKNFTEISLDWAFTEILKPKYAIVCGLTLFLENQWFIECENVWFFFFFLEILIPWWFWIFLTNPSIMSKKSFPLTRIWICRKYRPEFLNRVQVDRLRPLTWVDTWSFQRT